MRMNRVKEWTMFQDEQCKGIAYAQGESKGFKGWRESQYIRKWFSGERKKNMWTLEIQSWASFCTPEWKRNIC